jgi:hypothetical protein
MIVSGKNDDGDDGHFSSDAHRQKKLIVVAIYGVALVAMIIATPGVLLSTTNGGYALPGCVFSVNYWKHWTTCPTLEVAGWNSDLQPGFIKDRLRTGAAMDVLAILLVFACVVLASIGRMQNTRSVRIPLLLVSAVGAIVLLIAWGLATTILQEFGYRWGFALHVVAFVLHLLATLAAASVM